MNRPSAGVAPHLLSAFAQHGMSGMSLLGPTPVAVGPRPLPEPAPLVKRCPDCGRRISENKAACKGCLEKLLADIADGIPDQKALEAVLAQSPDARMFLEALRPFLKFTPAF